VERQLGRNEPCHCGSGKKYKHCCLEKDEAAARQARAKAAAAAAKKAAAEKPAEEAEPEKATQPPPRHATRQPWKKGATDARGFQRTNAPRRIGSS
jgi:hypothetical protein